MTLLEALQTLFTRYGFNHQTTCWVAYSGGLDSHVLLSLCHELRKSFPIRLCAIHVNHNLNLRAKAWVEHCQQTCGSYDIEFFYHDIHIEKSPGKSLEEEARNKRYDVFAKYLSPGDCLLTAHHQNDQAETVLLQLLRGSGPKGLSAMPVVNSFAQGIHARPFLDFSRHAIQEYAHQHQLQWIDDEMNANTQYMRNFLRHEIIPLLKTRLPNVEKAIARSASHCQESQRLLDAHSFELLEQVKGSVNQTLAVSKILQLNTDKQRLVLRSWIASQGFSLPNTKKILAILQNVLLAAQDKMPAIFWGNAELRRYRDNLYLMSRRSRAEPMMQHINWDFSEPLIFPSGKRLQAKLTHGKGLRSDLQRVMVRFRRTGEWVNLPGRNNQHCVKNLLQEWGVPPWKRHEIPFIFYEEQLICVPDYYLAKEYQTPKDAMGFEMQVG